MSDHHIQTLFILHHHRSVPDAGGNPRLTQGLFVFEPDLIHIDLTPQFTSKKLDQSTTIASALQTQLIVRNHNHA